MPSPIAVNVQTSPGQLWSGRAAPGINTLLLLNTDINNTVFVGTDLTSLVVPIAPNGSLSVDPGSNWYVVGLVAGKAPLVVVPNGQNNFLGLTQGLGNLAIPSVQSPNFETGIQGWQISKDGNAEFNNLTIRGTFLGFDWILNSTGLYFYSGTPALGNLILSIAQNAGTDEFGNTVEQGFTAYASTTAASLFNNATYAGMLFHQISSATVTLAPQIFAEPLNPGLVNESLIAVLTSGKESGGSDAALQLFSEAADGSNVAQAVLEIDGVQIFNVTSTVVFLLKGALSILGAADPSIFFTPNNSTHLTIQPQIVTSANQAGLVNEQLVAELISGKTGNDDAGLQLFSESADGTLPATAIIEFGGTQAMIMTKTGTSIIGVITIDSWHNITADSGWTGVVTPQYRLLPDGNVQLRGQLTHAGVTATTAFNSGHPLPAAYQPPVTRFVRPPQAQDAAGTTQIDDTGVISMRASGFTATVIILDGIYSLA